MTDGELRELDREVAVKVFGVVPRDVRAKGSTDTVTTYTTNLSAVDGFWTAGSLRLYYDALPYSSDIAAAWRVVDRLTEWPYVKVRLGSSYWHGDYCTVIAPDPSQRDDDCPVVRDAIDVWGESAPVAICRAALEAVKQSEGRHEPGEALGSGGGRGRQPVPAGYRAVGAGVLVW